MHSPRPTMSEDRRCNLLSRRSRLARRLAGACLAFGCCGAAGAFLTVPARASAQVTAAVGARPGTAQALAERALACLQRGDDALTTENRKAAYGEGVELARQAVVLDDRNADAHFALFANSGRLLLLEKAVLNPFTLKEATAELERTLQLDPNHPRALAAKGALYHRLPWLLGGSLSKAEAYLRRAIELEPNSVGARIELAKTYVDMGQCVSGVRVLEGALRLAERQNETRSLVEAQRLLDQLATQQ